MSSSKCPSGKIKRNSYITKNGTKVPSNCIVAQSNSGMKTSDILKKYIRI